MMMPEVRELPLNRYWRRARLYPALIAAAPIVALVLTLVPWSKLHLAQLFGVIGIGVLLYALSEFARRRGRRLEEGATDIGPGHTISMLWHGDNRIHKSIKDPIIEHVAKQLNHKRPTRDEEEKDRPGAEAFYKRCSNWMRNNTRGPKFEILFEENVAYGFHRNLFALKTIGLAANAFAIITAAVISFVRYKADPTYDFSGFAFVAFVGIAHAAWLLATVNRNAVVEASNTYAEQLLASYDSLVRNKPEAKARLKSAS